MNKKLKVRKLKEILEESAKDGRLPLLNCLMKANTMIVTLFEFQ